MPKRNITFTKPEEPSFLKKLKQQIGYKEGPTVDTKREALERDDGSDDENANAEEEQPTVVVLNEGDLTAEEADEIKKKQQEEIENAPADLSKKIIFNARKNKKNDDGTNARNAKETKVAEKSKKSGGNSNLNKSERKKAQGLLSFNEEDYDD